jgi:hypothetical protein
MVLLHVSTFARVGRYIQRHTSTVNCVKDMPIYRVLQKVLNDLNLVYFIY